MTEDEPVAPTVRRKDTLFRRVLLSGGAALDDAELVALALGSSRRLELPTLMQADPFELVQSGLLSERAAARLVGAVELVRRLAVRRSQRPRLPTASAIWNWVRPGLAGLRRETFRVLCVDARSRLLREVITSEGSVDSCHVDPREVFGPAICCRASAVVLVHNHPSGDPEPSLQDVALTHQLRAAGELLCIRVLDHVVVTETGFVSMMQRRMLELPVGGLVPSLQ